MSMIGPLRERADRDLGGNTSLSPVFDKNMSEAWIGLYVYVFGSIAFLGEMKMLFSPASREAILASIMSLPMLAAGMAHGQGCDLSFYQRFATSGTGPRTVAVGDLDGDGDLDIVVGNHFENDVSVLLNNGNGTFADQTRFAATRPTGIILGDLDGDGDLDMAMYSSDQSNNVGVLLNNGDGTFAEESRYASGSFSSDLALGDLDGDGDLDMLVSNFSYNIVGSAHLLWNNGDGNFATNSRLHPGSVYQGMTDVGIDDMDGDGLLDVVMETTGNPHAIFVNYNQGDGTFTSDQSFQISGIPKRFTIGDLNGNGILDIAAISTNGYLKVLLNNGNRYFDVSQWGYFMGNPSFLTLGDLDADGDLDLIVTIAGSGVKLLQGNGDGTFATTIISYDTGSEGDIALGDLDNDGDIDMVTPTAGIFDNISILFNQCVPFSCIADLTGDGVLNFFDVSVFLTYYQFANPLADFTGDGNFDFFDVSAFLQAFTAGCP